MRINPKSGDWLRNPDRQKGGTSLRRDFVRVGQNEQSGRAVFGGVASACVNIIRCAENDFIDHIQPDEGGVAAIVDPDHVAAACARAEISADQR